MKLLYQDDYAQFYIGNVLEVLKHLPYGTIQSIITSPPYWGMRTYGAESYIWPGMDGWETCNHQWSACSGPPTKNSRVGQNDHRIYAKANKEGQGVQTEECAKCLAYHGPLGHEEYPSRYAGHLAYVFSQCKDVLKHDASIWLNIDDTYVNSNHGYLMKGSLANVPAHVSMNMMSLGFIFKCDIIWNKPNAMPEGPVKRPTRSHEYIQMYSLHQLFKNNPLREDATSSSVRVSSPGQRNIRSVWNVPHKGSRIHNATFPIDLVKIMIVASSDEGDTVMDIFGGTGTVSYAAKISNRKSIYIDCNERYAGLALERYLTLPAKLLL